MAEYRTRQKLTDDDVRTILLSEGTIEELCEVFDVARHTISHYRRRKSKRALRIARDLGLAPIDTKAPFVPDEDDGRAYVVRGVRG